ncbi:MAG: class I SAM-dependent methyltransferase [Desulfuromonadales bacterium]
MKKSQAFQSPFLASPQPLPLTRIVPWSHRLVCDVLQPGDCAVDLTAGKGRDTLVLAQAVTPTGTVVAFDLQATAIGQTAEFLRQRGWQPTRWPAQQRLPETPGIYLVTGCHSALGQVVRGPVKVIMANLGYLPGGDHHLVTRPATTLAALEVSLDLLEEGGRLAVTVYPAHCGGAAEAQAVDAFFATLHQDRWRVLLLRTVNHTATPYLLIAEKNA